MTKGDVLRMNDMLLSHSDAHRHSGSRHEQACQLASKPHHSADTVAHTGSHEAYRQLVV